MTPPRRLLAVAALAALLAPAAPPPAEAAGPLPVPCPWLPEVEGRACRTLDLVRDGSAATCRVAALPGEACAALDGEVQGEAEVLAYEASWAHRAHALQRALMDTLTLVHALFPATHNSFNAEAYAPTLSGYDPNQVHTIAQQLRMDVRAVELDAHWWPSLADLGLGPVLCHGTNDHLGCSVDRPFRDGLRELRGWLDANPGEVVLLYVEDALDGRVGYDAAAADLDAALGDLLLRPGAGGCAAGRPLGLSPAAMRAAGARVLVVSGCGEGSAWPGMVHRYATNNLQSADFTPWPECGEGYTRADYDTKWIRFFEDRTWLTNLTGGSEDRIGEAEARGMADCGANMPSFDFLEPRDGRMAALVWSWAPGEPALGGPACAAQSAAGRFVARPCAEALPFACTPDRRAWVLAPAGPWAAGEAACAALGLGFAVPRTGFEQRRLLEDRGAGGEAWVGYADAEGLGAWAPR